MVRAFFFASGAAFLFVALAALVWPPALLALTLLVPLFLLGLRDAHQTRRAVLRNFPVIGHFRYLLEMIRPELNQYFVESNTDGKPFSRELRSLAYQRAKEAVSWARLSYYAGMAPRDGLNVPSDVAMYPIIPLWDRHGYGRRSIPRREVVWSGDRQRLTSGWLRTTRSSSTTAVATGRPSIPPI